MRPCCKRSLEITKGLFKGGIESELDVQQARTLYLGTLATIPQFEASLRQAQNALGTLLARAPGPLPEMAAGAKAVRDPRHDPIPNARLELIVDLPAEMLRRRPDVRAVEMQMAAQSALIGVSAADLYPSISLLGSLGLAATSVSGAPRVLDWAFGSEHGVERVRPRPPDQYRAAPGCPLPAALRTVPGRGAARGARSRRRRRRLRQDRGSRSRCSPTRWRRRGARSTWPPCNTARA